MEYRTEKQIVGEDGTVFRVGDRVSITWPNGGGMGYVVITKITDSGFHFNAGGRNKSVQFKNLARIEKRDE